MAKSKHYTPQKGLTYAQKQQQNRAAAASFHRRFAIQFCMDGVAIGLNEHLGLKDRELMDCLAVIAEWIMNIAELTVEDSADDKEIVYTKDQVDKRLQEILPPEVFLPWQERMTKAIWG